ncbi:hypothetical protein HW115_14890 [Verrucomicrobiaceae bacterium N1E253]|uniref:Uncharacterized protein n=1 Tax=Oceaniferula marina TaxID=2748318 RepID=A0A851GGJ3_9BACT|nr:hypothetical protein [Oceaniferula marina]NWK56908.1 hypothetical protein [Oceaniferula marina]
MNELVKMRGVVEGFERTTHTSGTSNRTSTTHLSLFRIGQNHVLLKTSIPSVIANGDEVLIAGMNINGQFQALACRNVTTNWTSPLVQQGCVFIALIVMAVVSFSLFFLVLPILMGCGCIFFAYKVKKHDKLLQEAHYMVLQD